MHLPGVPVAAVDLLTSRWNCCRTWLPVPLSLPAAALHAPTLLLSASSLQLQPQLLWRVLLLPLPPHVSARGIGRASIGTRNRAIRSAGRKEPPPPSPRCTTTTASAANISPAADTLCPPRPRLRRRQAHITAFLASAPNPCTCTDSRSGQKPPAVCLCPLSRQHLSLDPGHRD